MHDQGDSMKKALQSRRGRGIDVSIIVGPHEDESAEKEASGKGDLAPPPSGPLAVDKPTLPGMAQPMGQDLSQMHEGDLLGGMSDYDKQDVASRAPRSLMERAKQQMMMNK
jgi:hypothetical protein